MLSLSPLHALAFDFPTRNRNPWYHCPKRRRGVYYKRPAVRYMRADVEENDDGYIISVEVPGIEKSRLEISTVPEERQVTLSIKPKLEDAEFTKEVEESADQSTEENENTANSNATLDESPRAVKRERFQGGCSRTFIFPKDCDVATGKAKLENGVLELSFSKKETSKPKSINSVLLSRKT